MPSRSAAGRRYDVQRQDHMRAQLERILAAPNFSRNVYEIASKSFEVIWRTRPRNTGGGSAPPSCHPHPGSCQRWTPLRASQAALDSAAVTPGLYQGEAMQGML